MASCSYIDPLHVTSCDAINFLSAMLEDKQTVTMDFFILRKLNDRCFRRRSKAATSFQRQWCTSVLWWGVTIGRIEKKGYGSFAYHPC